MTRRLRRMARIGRAVIVLVGGALLLGLPHRPTLPVGAVDAAALTAFVIDGLRLLLTVAVWYLLLVTVLAALSDLRGLRPVLTPAVRRLTGVGIGALAGRLLVGSAAVGVSLPASAAAVSSPAGDAPVMIPDGPSEAVDPTSAEPDGSAPEAAGPRMLRGPSGGREPDRASTPVGPEEPPGTRLAPDGPPEDGFPVAERPPAAGDPPEIQPPVMRHDPAPRPVQEEATGTPAATRADRPERSDRHVVLSGESFWSISADLAHARAGDRTPDLAEIVATWKALVDRNAGILVDPGNPDLLHCGQVIDLGGLT